MQAGRTSELRLQVARRLRLQGEQEGLALDPAPRAPGQPRRHLWLSALACQGPGRLWGNADWGQLGLVPEELQTKEEGLCHLHPTAAGPEETSREACKQAPD